VVVLVKIWVLAASSIGRVSTAGNFKMGHNTTEIEPLKAMDRLITISQWKFGLCWQPTHQ